MIWNSDEAKKWIINYALVLRNSGNISDSNYLFYNAHYCDCCKSQEKFITILKYLGFDVNYINWSLKEIGCIG